MPTRLHLIFFIALVTFKPLPAQHQLDQPRQQVLKMAEAGIPDTSAYLAAAEDLAYAAIEVGNLSIARNAAMILSDMVERYAGASLQQIAAGRLANARVTYQISRRHPDGMGIAQSVIDVARESGDWEMEAEGLYELARFQRGNRLRKERVLTLQQLQDLAEGQDGFTAHLARAYLERGRDEIEGGDPQTGIELAEEAASLYDKAGQTDDVFLVHDLKAKGYQALEEYDLALREMNLAITYYGERVGMKVDQDEDGNRQLQVGEINTFFDATTLLNHRARLFRAMGRPNLALKDYQSLIELRGRQRDANVVASSQMRQSRIIMEFMSEAIECHFELLDEDPEHAWEALALSEQMKAYGLLARMTLREQRGDSGENEALRRRIASLEREQPEGIPTSPELALLELELSERLERAGTLPEGHYRVTAEDAKALVGNLPGGMLQYATGYDESYLFYVDEKGQLTMSRIEDPIPTHIAVIDWRKTIDESAYATKSIRPTSLQDSLDGAFLAQGRDLLRRVLPGVNVDSLPRDLLIVPDQMMNFLPFAALPLDSLATPFGYADLQYLIDRHDISYAYSLRHRAALADLTQPRKATGLLAFAPAFTGNASASDVLAVRRNLPAVKSDTAELPGLTPLAYNAPEAEMAARLLEVGEVVTGPSATKATFLDRLGDADILHLSSHGVMSARHPKYSFVAFSQSTPDLLEEELIYYNDLASYGLDAELVVLSACETGMGMVAPGETALTMASAFIDAGARSVVSNLWSVDDAATHDLMEYFYASLAAGNGRRTAVNEAQRQLKASGAYTHPFYWGALTLYGNEGALELSSGAEYWKYGLVGLAALLLVGGFFYLRK